ncbi:NAD(P)-dependent oxidoreductase [Mycobacterium sp. 1274761.0]|uniref:NAD-dependent epimerase/dehydratase family protein n=1 Tax=Mycobacterium sp. 1274761.0 TaxID=1834077 RepID=UPI0007FF143B|nr:NAD(P)-dependent oxidoreductase [Mycobacterium sp. 1274761.0]OBK71052.1 oxidoreductase [Mycobacterium sp. 1274761.0]
MGTRSVLVTGAFGMVGTETVLRLREAGAAVIATDLQTPANLKAARRLPDGVEVRWSDLTDESQTEALLAEVAPATIIHLAAVIPTACYEKPDLARAVNVEGTRSLVTCAQRLPSRPRFVMASSVAVHGSRNPHRNGLLHADSPLRPVDSYGSQKLAAELIVRNSRLDWAILRLGAVVSARLRSLPVSSNVLFLEWAMPSDGRVNTVDVRDVASAFAAATTADIVGETLMIGGDESHRLLQGDMGPAIVAAMGLRDCYPAGRPGNPDDDAAWFVCDWMDTARAQEALAFQNHSWPDMLHEIGMRVGWWRYLFAAIAPAVRLMLRRRMPYRGLPGVYADPWNLVTRRWPGAAPE